jgi:DNA-binding winged helix-turn-helix (wHTH) protein/TolB-like protein/Tfp pilus assembly protein PilF
MPKAYDLLVYLAANSKRLIEKDELMSAIWPDTIVEENNLTQNISAIRKVLGERHKENRFIATIPGRGYRFVADVRRVVPETVSDGEIAETTDALEPVPVRTRRLPLVIGAVVLLAGLAITAFLIWPRAKGSPEGISSIAVLPFKPIAMDKRDESLEMGMADALILKLSDVATLKVRPFTAVRRFGAPDQDAIAAGKELGADAVLDGRLQSADDRIRATVQLVRVSDGQQLWSGQFDEKITDIFALQDSIARKVANQLSVTLGRRGSKKYTLSVDAYQLYMRGILHTRRLIKPEVEKGISYFNQAIETDPSYALAYVELANAHRALVLSSDESPLDEMPKAKAAALRAVELDPELAEAWASLASSDFWYDWDWTSAETHHLKALQLDPGNSSSRTLYAHLLSNIGRHDEAIDEIRKAREAEPANLLTNAFEGQILFFAGRHADAEQALKRTIDLDPNFWLAHLFLARVYLADARFSDAIASAQRAAELSGGNAEANASMAFSMARAGRKEESANLLRELLTRSQSRYVPRYALAQIHLALGDKDRAMAELEKAYLGRESLMVFLKVEPKWDELRGDPRFIELMKRMRF